MSATHRIRPHAADKWQDVTDKELATIKEQVGPRTFAAGYAVEPLAKKPAPLETTDKPARSEKPAASTEQK